MDWTAFVGTAEDVAALFLLDWVDRADLARWAERTAQIVAGAAEEALWQLCDGSDRTRGEIQELLAEAAGLDYDLTDDGTAGVVTRLVCRVVVGGQVPPYRGARVLWGLGQQVASGEEFLVGFVGLASEWEDVPHARTEIERKIVELAGRTLRDM